MNYLSNKAAKDNFDNRHGNDAIQIEGVLIFSDGAMRETGPYGIWIEPSDDLYERSGVQVRYHEELWRRAKEQFDQLKSSLLGQAKSAVRHATANSPPEPPSEESIAALKKLQRLVAKCYANLEAARAALRENKPSYLCEREARAEANHERNAAALAAIEKIVT